MKRLFTLTLLLALTLSGCKKPAATPAANTPTNNPIAKAEVAPKSPEATKALAVFTSQTGSLLSSQEVPLLEQINRENVRVLAAAMPALVRISAARQPDPHLQLFGKDLPFQFHAKPDTPKSVQQDSPSYGSGVIISRDGYIVTNYHVVEDARDINVELEDKRVFSARVIASDTPVDVAVLKIDATNLSALPWGNSDKVQVGEQVFAIGNPFNLEDSASKGIVSATGRNLPDSGSQAHYENFIQTDAAINPGNSGGALINIHGELIGINTAIASYSGGNQGVGFAIPSNLARYAVEGLLKNGKLISGYLGVKLPESIDEGVSATMQLGSQRGALLAGVIPNSPAEQAGLRAGDFITQVDGHRINSIADLRLVVAQIPIGKQVSLGYIRAGTPQSATVKIVEIPQELQAKSTSNPAVPSGTDIRPPSGPVQTASGVENVLGGLQVNDLNDKTRQKFNIDQMVTNGVVISDVQDGSLAQSKGIQRSDVIESANVSHGSSWQLASAKDFADLAKNLKADQSVVLLIHHGKGSSFVYLAPPK